MIKKTFLSAIMLLAIFSVMSTPAFATQDKDEADTSVSVESNQISENETIVSGYNSEVVFEQTFEASDKTKVQSYPIADKQHEINTPFVGPDGKHFRNISPLDTILSMNPVLTPEMIEAWKDKKNIWSEKWPKCGKVWIQRFPIDTEEREKSENIRTMFFYKGFPEEYRFKVLDIYSGIADDFKAKDMHNLGSIAKSAMKNGADTLVILNNAGELVYLLRGWGIGGNYTRGMFNGDNAAVAGGGSGISRGSGKTGLEPFMWAVSMKGVWEKPKPAPLPEPPKEEVKPAPPEKQQVEVIIKVEQPVKKVKKEKPAPVPQAHVKQPKCKSKAEAKTVNLPCQDQVKIYKDYIDFK